MFLRALVLLWSLCLWGALAVNGTSDSDSVRLVSGRSPCSGSLQIQDSDQSWTSVCEGALDRRGAEVLCRELGCGAPLLQGALSPLGQTFHCEGHESALMDCPRNQTRTDPGTCPTLQLTCSELRLVDGASRCEGSLELRHRGEWRRMESWGTWDLEAAAAVCRGLDCGYAVSTEQKQQSHMTSESLSVRARSERFRKKDVWVVISDWVKNEAAVRNWVSNAIFHGDSLAVVCSDSVRLVSGRSLCSGSVQIRDQSSDWTSVCEGALDRRGAEVLCRELGCGAPLLQGTLSPLWQTFHCEGHESALMDCPRNQTRTDPGTCPGPALNLTCSEPLRLVGGLGRCEGTVEVKHRGEWRRMVPESFLGDWGLEAAAAVCRLLDCGSAFSIVHRKGFAVAEVWPVGLDCVMKAAPRGCDFRDGRVGVRVDSGLEVVCSDSVRLVSGRSLCSGSLQIRDQSSDRSWTSVCEGALHHRGAEVLCRELGCGAPLLQGALSPLGQTFHCEGHESALMDCPRNQTRTDPGTCPTLNLTCSELRLVGGASRCEGTVELRNRGEWRRLEAFNDPWDLEAAAVLCQGLGCGSAVSTEQREGFDFGDVWQVRPLCVERRSAVTVADCAHGGSSRSGLGLVCSDSVRLVSGRSLCSGSLQIRDHSRSWTSVCEGALDRRGAEVLCRELGCGAPLLQGALSPLGRTFHCEGHESALMDCPRNQTRTDPGTCPTLQLTCSELRLVGGARRCEGTLEVTHRGQWRRMTSLLLRGHGDLEFTAVLCRDLGCGSAVSTEQREGYNRSDVWFVDAKCVKETAALTDCFLRGSSGSHDGLEVVCLDSVRLVSGRSLCSGSLQIRDSDRSWTSVCEGALDRRGAEVLCRELGCGAPLLQGALSPLGQMFHCEGHESALMDCPRNQTRTDPGTCPTLQLTCSEPLRLVGGASRCEGTVEVKHSGEWRRMMSRFSLDLGAAAAVCRGLGCGSAALTEKRRGFDVGDAWLVDRDCVKKKSVRYCVVSGSLRHSDGHVIVCSDSVRLISGRSLCSGSLQIWDLDRSWTSVCEGALDRRGAEVLCRELGCGAPLLQGALSPLGQTFHCEGHESALMDCPRNQTRTNPGTCPTLNLTCSEPLRLVGGASRCEGAVQLQHRGEWGRVQFANKRRVADVVCWALDCGSSVSRRILRGLNESLEWFVDGDCVRSSVRDCVLGGSSVTTEGQEVVCSEPPGLVGGASRCEGTVEVVHRGERRRVKLVNERRTVEVVCQDLDCVYRRILRGLDRSRQWFVLADCVKTSVRSCVAGGSSASTEGQEVVCSGTV